MSLWLGTLEWHRQKVLLLIWRCQEYHLYSTEKDIDRELILLVHQERTPSSAAVCVLCESHFLIQLFLFRSLLDAILMQFINEKRVVYCIERSMTITSVCLPPFSISWSWDSQKRSDARCDKPFKDLRVCCISSHDSLWHWIYYNWLCAHIVTFWKLGREVPFDWTWNESKFIYLFVCIR